MKTARVKITCILGSLLLQLGCSDGSNSSQDGSNQGVLGESRDRTTNEARSTDSSSAQANFQGFIPSAFEVSVDGNTYLDLEDFYTQELSRLPERVKNAGYTEDYEISFDAEIGFADLWTEMTVYIVSDTDRGYFGKGQVSADGSFSIKLPEEKSAGSYKVRANKRIGIELKNDSEIIKICYNFSAMDQSVSFDEQQKPIILKDFISKITNYACTQVNSDGLNIPEASRPSQTQFKFEVGQNKRDILSVVGASNLYIDSDTTWCFTTSDYSKNTYCALQHYISCQCSINFDEEGNLNSVENIATEFLGDSLIY